jgi:hypothetical protein
MATISIERAELSPGAPFFGRYGRQTSTDSRTDYGGGTDQGLWLFGIW